MVRRWLRSGTLVVSLLALIGSAFLGGVDPRPAPLLAQGETFPSPTPTLTATLTATPTATSTLPDLSITVSSSTDPVAAGQILNYFVTVRNNGSVVTGPTTLTGQIPTGTSAGTLPTGCSEDTLTRSVRCPIIPLTPGQQLSFSINLHVTASSGTLFNRFVVDPDNLVVESDESNNVADRTVTVTPTTPTATPVIAPPATATSLPTAIPTPVPPLPTLPPPPPIPPAPPTPAPPPPPAMGQLWLQVLEPTDAYSAVGDLLWTAQPGEWYYVLAQEADWAFAPWEGDPPNAAVWIQVDGRVALGVY